MAEEIKDPREIGVSGLKGIDLNTKTKAEEEREKFISSAKDVKINWRDNSVRKEGLQIRGPVENVGVEGWGTSRYDKRMTQLGELVDLNESRANIQPWYDKIGAGILKGTTLALTTFADGIAGTIVGAFNVLDNADEIENSDNPWRELGNQFINNPFSTLMQDINEKVESVLPNYYTKAEQEDPWWEHIFSANFIGDKFLKNLGFTIGAAYSGKVSAGAISKAMGLKGVRDAFKGAVTTASGRTLNTSSEIARAYKSGDAFMDGVKLTDDLGKAAKQLRNAEWTLKTVGAINAAMGEGRIEAITNSKQWESYHRQLLDGQYQKDVSNIEKVLYEEHPEWFSLVQTGTPETGIRYKMMLTSPEGQKEWEKRKADLDMRYNQSIEELAKYRASMANADFGLNVVMLSGSNLWQWGRFLAGGYNSGRLANGLIKGSLKEGFSVSKRASAGQIARALSNPLAEMNEEMMQSWFSEGTGLHQASRLNSFYGAKVDPEAELDTVNFLDSMVKGFSNIYGNAENWEEGFIGGLTGLLGVPKISRKAGKNGKNRLKFSLDGELWGGLADARSDKAQAQSLVNALNQRIQSPEFLNYYQGFVRHQKYQNDMEAALANGDNFEYKNAEAAQFVSDAIMFEKAGRLQDLYDIIDEAGNVTLDDVDDLRNLAVDKTTGKSIFDGKSDQEVLNHVRKQVEDTKERLKAYSQISTDLKTLYGEDISDEFLEEMTWMMTQVNDWEKRFKSLFNEVKTEASEIIQDYRDRRYFGRNADRKIGELIDITPEGLLNTLSRKEVREALSDEKMAAEKDRNKSLRNMKLFKDISDMLKIYEARNEFIDRYTALSKNPEMFTKQMQTILNEVKEQNTKRATDEAILKASSVTSVKDLMEVLSQYQDYKDEILNALKNGDNEGLKKIAQNLENLEEASKVFSDIMSNMVPSPEVVSAKNIIQDAFDHAESLDEAMTVIEEVKDIPKEVKDTIDEILNKYVGQSRSKKSSKKDQKKSKNKPKKPTTGNRLFDLGSDNPDEGDAELKEEKGEVEEEGAEEESGESEEVENTEREEKDSDLVEELSKKSNEELRKIAKEGDPSLTKEDNVALRRLAVKVHNNRVLPAAGEPGDIDVEDNIGSDGTTSIQGLRSWVETEYDFNALKDRTERKAVKRNTPIVKALQRLGTYEFIDEGYLADMLEGNEDLPIHLVVSSDPALSGKILLAVRIGEKDKAVVPIEGSDGERYQVVGVLGFNRNNKEAVRNYNLIVDAVNDEYSDYNGTAGSVFVSSYETRVTHIYSGRMVKSTEDEDVQERDLTKEFLRGRPLQIGVYYSSSDFRTPGLDEDAEVVPLNINNQNPREGSIWLMTKEADGRWYPKHLTAKRFTEEEYPLEEYGDTPIMNRIVRDIEILTNPNSTQYKKSLAKFDLKEVLHFPEGTDILFSKEGNIVSISGFKNDITRGARSADEATVMFLQALMSDELGLRFNIVTSELTDKTYQESILASGIFTTDLYQPGNVNASFDIANINSEGKPSIPKEDTSLKGHTGRRGIQSVLNRTTVMLSGKRFSVDSEGNILDEAGEKVTDSDTIDEIQLMAKINSGEINPVEGSSNLYIGYYLDGGEFGIVNGRVKTGKELNNLKKKAERNHKKELQKEKTGEVELEMQSADKGNLSFLESLYKTSGKTEETSEKSPERRPEKRKSKDNIGLEMEKGDEALLMSMLGIEPSGPVEKAPESKKEKDKPSFTLTESFAPVSETARSNISAYIRGNRAVLRELGFRNTDDFIDYLRDPKNSLPDPDTITSEEAFKSLIDTIKNCR